MDANAIMTNAYRKQMLDEAEHARLVKLATQPDGKQVTKRPVIAWSSLHQVIALATGRRAPAPVQECWDTV